MDELKATSQHDANIFQNGISIFSQDDLRGLINTIYGTYRYTGTQLDKLVKLIDFLALESNSYHQPELATQSDRLSDYLNTLCEFLKVNFNLITDTDDDDAIYGYQTEDITCNETEAFLTEFQLVSLDVEKAYRNYLSTVTNFLQI
jgi:hypothetical protein